jgi:hypothetical protein
MSEHLGGNMTTMAQMTGMQGVYLVASELTKRGLIVSPTSRSSYGADLLVTDQRCRQAWSVQVKTNFGRPSFWLLNKQSAKTKSGSHVYVLVNLGQKNSRQKLSPPDFYIVPSGVLARRMRVTPPRRRTRSIFYSIFRERIREYQDKWTIFGFTEPPPVTRCKDAGQNRHTVR